MCKRLVFPTLEEDAHFPPACTSGITAKNQAALIVCVFHSVNLHIHFCERMTLFIIPLTRGIN